MVQVKVKKDSYTSHNHSFLVYNLKNNEPQSLEFRVKCDPNNENQHIFRSADHKNIKVVAIILIRSNFLAE